MSANLNPVQLKAIELLLSLPTKKAVAKFLGVSPGTISGWLKISEFRYALEQSAKEKYKESTLLLQAYSINAVKTLHKGTKDKASKNAIDAANKLLSQASKFVQEQALTSQIEALEAMLVLTPAQESLPHVATQSPSQDQATTEVDCTESDDGEIGSDVPAVPV